MDSLEDGRAEEFHGFEKVDKTKKVELDRLVGELEMYEEFTGFGEVDRSRKDKMDKLVERLEKRTGENLEDDE